MLTFILFPVIKRTSPWEDDPLNPVFNPRDQCFIEHSGHPMTHFVCQRGWAMVSRYLIKNYSGCFFDGVFG